MVDGERPRRRRPHRPRGRRARGGAPIHRTGGTCRPTGAPPEGRHEDRPSPEALRPRPAAGEHACANARATLGRRRSRQTAVSSWERSSGSASSLGVTADADDRRARTVLRRSGTAWALGVRGGGRVCERRAVGIADFERPASPWRGPLNRREICCTWQGPSRPPPLSRPTHTQPPSTKVAADLFATSLPADPADRVFGSWTPRKIAARHLGPLPP
jgi:hypothetical protein